MVDVRFGGQHFHPWPQFHTQLYAVIALALITFVVLFRVTWFGRIEPVLAILKILAIVSISICAISILTGGIGDDRIIFSVIYRAEV
jgi:amino acid permease